LPRFKKKTVLHTQHTTPFQYQFHVDRRTHTAKMKPTIKIFVPGEQVSDSISWIPTADQSLCAKSSYSLQCEGQTRTTFKQDIWRAWAPVQKLPLGCCGKTGCGVMLGSCAGAGRMKISAWYVFVSCKGITPIPLLPLVRLALLQQSGSTSSPFKTCATPWLKQLRPLRHITPLSLRLFLSPSTPLVEPAAGAPEALEVLGINYNRSRRLLVCPKHPFCTDMSLVYRHLFSLSLSSCISCKQSCLL
jgi:hypothetical protein